MSADPDLLAAAIQVQASRATNETDLRIRIEPLVDAARIELGLTTDPSREKTLDASSNTVTFKGRADTMYGALVIEYEPPGALDVAGKTRHAAKQAREYMWASAAASTGHEHDALRRHAGVIFDGHRVGFLRATGPFDATRPLQDQLEALIPLDGPFPVNAASTANLLLFLRALGRKRLDGRSLATTFGPDSKSTSIAKEFVAHLVDQLASSALPPKAVLLTKEWQRAFGAVYSQDATKARQDAGVLAKLYGAPTATKLPTLLFAIQTYYAFLMKLLAVEVLSLQQGSFVASQATKVANASAADRRKAVTELENGSLFAGHGIENFLEGDYFSWYVDAWTADTGELVRRVALELSRFEPASSTLDPDAVRDLLKDLYQYLLPKKVRHDLGEYYTPDWLADYLLDKAGYTGAFEDRFLDPACGSGTFLLRAMSRIVAEAHRTLANEETTARAILSNVVGFDLNPVAVLAARTNYLLGLGTMLRRVTPISLPVYLADSLLAPLPYSRLVSSSFTKARSDHLVRSSSEGDFKFPLELANPEGLRVTTEELERGVPSRIGPAAFIERVANRTAVKDPSTLKLLAQLYEKVEKLDDAGKNDIWARLLRNSFAPALSGRFSFVVGNPPWINWESLADDYRKVTTRLWELHGLFTLKGLSSILGGSKRDIAMLFWVCAADYYLAADGVLAYLFPQPTFQNSPAGDGFRKFRLGTSEPIGPTSAGDLVALQPFEGAKNWTGYLIGRKGHEVAYPIPYDFWTRNGPPIDQDASLEKALERATRTNLFAAPAVPSNRTSPWVIGTTRTIPASQRMAGTNAFTPRAGVTTWADGIYRGTITGRLGDGRVTFANDPDRAKNAKPPRITAAIERDFVYPFIEWKDLKPFSAVPTGYELIPQNPATRVGYAEAVMSVSHPHTYDYLQRFRGTLEKRSGFRRYFARKGKTSEAFYSVFNFGNENLAEHRVAWATMGTQFRAAAIEPVEDAFLGRKAPQFKNTVIFVPVGSAFEGHYLAALLNSTPLNYLATFSSVRGGKSFGSGGFLSRVRIGRYESSNPTHAELSYQAQRASAATSADDPTELATARQEIDLAAGRYWDITEDEVKEMKALLELARRGGAVLTEAEESVEDEEEESPSPPV